jgi:hypothetical protein
MPGDPEECREHATVCQQLANTASTEHVREVFQNLARTWLRLRNVGFAPQEPRPARRCCR